MTLAEIYRNEGIEKGRAAGIEEGRVEGKYELAKTLLQKKLLTKEQIIRASGLSEEEFEDL